MVLGSAMAARARGPVEAGASGPARVIYVTGKGGAGKSTISTLVARQAAARGLATALVQTGTRALDRAVRLPEAEPFSVFRLDERAALGQLVARLLRVRFLAGRLMDSRTFSAVAAAAPGVRELVYMSYIFDVARSRVGDAPFDLVVVDGFATGHAAAMLSSPYTSADLIAIGPAARIARDIGRMTSSPDRFRVVSVTLPEELAATECHELRARLDELGITTAATVVNAAYPQVLGDAQLEWLRAAGTANGTSGSRDALLYEARRRRQATIVSGIAAEGITTLTLPYDFDAGGGHAGATPAAIDCLLDRCLDASSDTRP